MINSISITNFKTFRDVTVSDCRPVNVIVGDNGSGKTALLEAIFVAAGATPELLLRARAWRGLDISGQVSGSEFKLQKELWGDLFYDFDDKKAATISLRGSGDYHNRKLTIRFNRGDAGRATPPPRNKPQLGPKITRDIPPIEFRWAIHGAGEFTSAPVSEDGKIVVKPASRHSMSISFFTAGRPSSNIETVSRFSSLSKRTELNRFNQNFQELFSRLCNISIELSFGSPVLFAEVEGLSQKLPLSLASGGVSKLASMLLAFSDLPGGVILIDEVESGFYYKRLPLVWHALYKFCKEFRCQLFVSTHSEECLKALLPLVENTETEGRKRQPRAIHCLRSGPSTRFRPSI